MTDIKDLFSGIGVVIDEKINVIELAFAILVAIFILWTHRKNIKRLLNHEEPKFKFKKTEE